MGDTESRYAARRPGPSSTTRPRGAASPEVRPVMGFAMLAFLAAFAFAGMYGLYPPKAAPVTAPAAEFSAERAMEHVRAISQKPHPIGSPANAVVRDYIMAQLRAMGLRPKVQKATVVSARRAPSFAAATVQNIAARLAGTNSSRGRGQTGHGRPGHGQAVMLVAHYDSVPSGPGASDDGTAVAMLLETLRALKAGPSLKHDVILLFTDGEEAGLLGAKAFVDEHPWAKDVGLVLNFEARGTGGAAFMFETSPDNGWLIREFAKAAPHPQANSLTYDVYKLLPNDTDFSMFKQAGMQGFNFAFLDGSARYHTALDNARNTDHRSLQHQGSYALSLSRRFGNLERLDVPPKPDIVYFSVLGTTLVQYPRTWVMPLAILAAAIFVGVVVLGFRRKRLTALGLTLGFLAFLVGLAGSEAVAWGLQRTLHLGSYTQRANLYILGFAALTVAVASGVCVGFHKKIGREDLAAGGLLGWVLITVAVSWYLPGGSYLFAWPLLFSLLGLGYLVALPRVSRGSRVSWKTFAVLAVTATPGLILLVPITYLLFVGLTLGMPQGGTFFLVLLLGSLVPHLLFVAAAAPRAWLLPAVSLVVGAGFVIGALSLGIDPAHPKSDVVFYGLDAQSGKATWVSTDMRPDEWTKQFFAVKAKAGGLPEFFPFSRGNFLTGNAPAETLVPPNVTLLDDKTTGKALKTRLLRLHIASPRRAPGLWVYVMPTTEVLAAQVNGKALTPGGEGRDGGAARGRDEEGFSYFSLRYDALPDDGIELTLKTIASSRPVELKVVDQSYGLPRLPGFSIMARPNHIIPGTAGHGGFDGSTLVSRTVSF